MMLLTGSAASTAPAQGPVLGMGMPEVLDPTLPRTLHRPRLPQLLRCLLARAVGAMERCHSISGLLPGRLQLAGHGRLRRRGPGLYVSREHQRA